MKKTKILILSLLCLTLVIGCKKKDTSDLEPTSFYTTGLDVNSFYGTIDGIDYEYIEQQDDVSGGVGTNKVLNVGSYSTAKYSTNLYYYDNDEDIAGVDIGTLGFIASDDTPTNSEFEDFVKKGVYNYSIDAEDGIEFFWMDDNGTEWSTSLGTANQTGSSFEIVEVKETTSFFGDYTITFRATFNCTLYDGTGQKKVLTNGSYVGSFSNI